MSTSPRAAWQPLTLRLVMWFGIGLYLVLTGAYVFFGATNADEGWYLVAAERVWRGQALYRDFAFTQMPAWPYLYGLLLQLAGPSLLAGRLLTATLGALQLGAALGLAQRYAGPRAAALTALLLGTFTNVIYYDTIVKTYALVALLFTLTFLALPRTGGSPWRWGLAFACATLAAQVRLSAAAFWAPIVLYGLWTVRGGCRARAALAAWLLVLWLPAVYSLTRDLEATRWNLLTYHLNQWQENTLLGRVAEIFWSRLAQMVVGLAPHVGLSAVIFGAIARSGLRVRRITPLGLMAISLCLFAAAHLTNGVLFIEYFVPAAAAAMPLLAIGLVYLWSRASQIGRLAWAGAILTTLMLALIPNHPAELDLSTRPTTVEEIQTAGRVVAEWSNPTDLVLALEGTIVAVEAQRDLLPGYELSYFALQSTNDAEAQRLHVLTLPLVTGHLEREAAKVVILTDHDWELLSALGDVRQLQAALAKHYEQVWAQTDFGQWSRGVVIYVCRTCP